MESEKPQISLPITGAIVRFMWLWQLEMLSQALSFVAKLLIVRLLPVVNWLRRKREDRKKGAFS